MGSSTVHLDVDVNQRGNLVDVKSTVITADLIQTLVSPSVKQGWALLIPPTWAELNQLVRQ